MARIHCHLSDPDGAVVAELELMASALLLARILAAPQLAPGRAGSRLCFRSR